MSAGPADLWLRALQRLTASVAHELRNPLNGVALNLEVLRGRVGRGQTDVTALSGFAEAAAADLTTAIRLADALLAVARPVRVPVELGVVLAPIAVLAGAVARARGGSLEIALPEELSPALEASGDAVRAALASALLAAVERGATVSCRAVYEAAAVIVELRTSGGAVDGMTLEQDTVAGLAACGIAAAADDGAIVLRIGRAGGAAS